MSIKESLEKINPVRERPAEGSASVTLGRLFSNGVKPFYPVLLLMVVSGVFFVLGRFSAMERGESSIKIDYPASSQVGSVINSTTASTSVSVAETPTQPTQTGTVIGSKSGKKYYFPWCGTVKRILPQNQVHFASIEAARAAGFTPGGNCKGLN